jgi:Flp pilus assembly protein TadD
VLREDLSNAQVRGNLGILLYRRGLYQQAEEELAAACRLAPDHGLAHYYRGETLNRLERLDEAMEALERAVEILPSHSRAYYALGILLDRKNRPEEAAVMYRKSRELRNP